MTTLYETFTVFKSTHHLSLNCTTSIHPTPLQLNSLWSTLILFSQLYAWFKVLFQITLPNSCMCHMSQPSPLPLFITIIIPGKGCKSQISTLCSFLQSPRNSSISGPNIFLSALFLNTLSLLCPSQCERLSFMYSDCEQQHKIF